MMMRSRAAAAIAGILAGYVGPGQPLAFAAPNLKAPELEKKKHQASITATYKTETELNSHFGSSIGDIVKAYLERHPNTKKSAGGASLPSSGRAKYEFTT